MPLTPKQQEIVAKVLIKAGASQPVEFDAYEEDYLWDRE